MVAMGMVVMGMVMMVMVAMVMVTVVMVSAEVCGVTANHTLLFRNGAHKSACDSFGDFARFLRARTREKALPARSIFSRAHGPVW